MANHDNKKRQRWPLWRIVITCMALLIGVTIIGSMVIPIGPRIGVVPPATFDPARPRPSATPFPTLTARPAGTGFRGGTDANPVFFGEGPGQEVDPPWFPCSEGQVKGDRDTGFYYVQTAAFYNRIILSADCFDSVEAARLVGYELPDH